MSARGQPWYRLTQMNTPLIVLMLVLAGLTTGYAGCGTSTEIVRAKSLDASAGTIKAAGKEFLLVAKIADEGFKSGLVSKDLYGRWAAFVPKFQKWYKDAEELWEASVASHDAALQGQLNQSYQLMAQGLFNLANEIYTAVRPKQVSLDVGTSVAWRRPRDGLRSFITSVSRDHRFASLGGDP